MNTEQETPKYTVRKFVYKGPEFLNKLTSIRAIDYVSSLDVQVLHYPVFTSNPEVICYPLL